MNSNVTSSLTTEMLVCSPTACGRTSGSSERAVAQNISRTVISPMNKARRFARQDWISFESYFRTVHPGACQLLGIVPLKVESSHSPSLRRAPHLNGSFASVDSNSSYTSEPKSKQTRIKEYWLISRNKSSRDLTIPAIANDHSQYRYSNEYSCNAVEYS